MTRIPRASEFSNVEFANLWCIRFNRRALVYLRHCPFKSLHVKGLFVCTFSVFKMLRNWYFRPWTIVENKSTDGFCFIIYSIRHMYELNWAITFFLFVFLYMCLFYVGQVHVIVDLKLFLALSWKHTYWKHTYWKHTYCKHTYWKHTYWKHTYWKHTYWKWILCHWKNHFDIRVQRKGGHMDKYVHTFLRLRGCDMTWIFILTTSPFLIRVGHPFISKEQNDLCLLFRSFMKNGTIFAFFSVLYKRTEQSLRSFPLLIKEWNNLCVLFHSL